MLISGACNFFKLVSQYIDSICHNLTNNICTIHLISIIFKNNIHNSRKPKFKHGIRIQIKHLVSQDSYFLLVWYYQPDIYHIHKLYQSGINNLEISQFHFTAFRQIHLSLSIKRTKRTDITFRIQCSNLGGVLTRDGYEAATHIAKALAMLEAEVKAEATASQRF